MSVKKKLTKEEAERILHCSLRMGLDTYLRMCRENGFPVTWHKPRWQLVKELKIYKDQAAVIALARSNKNPSTIKDDFHRIISTDVRWNESHCSILIEYPSAQMIRGLDEDSKKALLRLVDVAFGKDSYRTKLLGDLHSVRMLVRAAKWYPYWVRDASEWEIDSHSLRRQKSSLLRHLFAKYRVPLFMDNVWERDWNNDNDLQEEWFIHIAQGGNIRTARMLPFPLTKKMAHFFLEAPPDYTIQEAFVHGQVIAFGGNLLTSRALRGVRIGSLDDDFRQSFLRFIAENPMLDRRQYGPILDYICHVKYEPTQVAVGNGNYLPGPPLQPNFSMAGRNANTLMEQVTRWHRELSKAKRPKNLYWAHSPIKDFKLEEGTGVNERTWTIVELTSSASLFDEGRAMKHCVASYAESCASGRCSIWSLCLYEIAGGRRRATIEVDKNDTIVQARGPINKALTQQEFRVIRLWASKNGLKMSSWIK